jgi:hypothetical protein
MHQRISKIRREIRVPCLRSGSGSKVNKDHNKPLGETRWGVTNLIPGEEEETKLHQFLIQIEEAKRMGIINSK